MYDDFEGSEEIQKDKPFSFVQSSLQRINWLLMQLNIVSSSNEFQLIVKQEKKISLLKSLLQNSANLVKFDEDFIDEVLTLDLPTRRVIIKGREVSERYVTKELDLKIDKLVIKICAGLRKKGFY